MSQSPDSRERQLQAGKNQALFREINERVRQLEAGFDAFAPRRTAEWFCECANETCFEHITMSHEDYDAIRENRAWFFVVPSDEHVWPDFERVTEKDDRYWVVEKLG
jgi:hypothetical protein